MLGLLSNKESLEYPTKGRFILLIFFVIHFYVDAGFNHYSGIKHLRDGVKIVPSRSIEDPIQTEVNVLCQMRRQKRN